MKRLILYLLFAELLFPIGELAAQKKMLYHPCFLLDSVNTKIEFIRKNSVRIFDDTSDCKQELLDAIGERYLTTKDNKYLSALSAIRQNPSAKVEEFYIDLVQRFLQDDFPGFLQQLYASKGGYLPLEKEMVAAMNMIVGDRPLKQKYMGLLNVEISKAKDKKDLSKEAYLKKLRQRIEEEKVR
ncbi:MAG: hypothetical protein IPP77_12835 [Bacteroidetes bacterium]|nr:hypothetical protein [Bacteroidota bacterium]